MEKFNINGYIYQIKNKEEIKLDFFKRSFVLEANIDEDKHDLLLFDLYQDNCKMIDGFNVGDKVKVSFYIKGKIFTSMNNEKKIIQSLKCLDIWKLN